MAWKLTILPVFCSNNVHNHGPGGQSKYNDPDEADPCFAKVIDGFEAVERLHQVDVEEGSYRRIKHYVAIKSVRLLPKEEEEAGEQQPQWIWWSPLAKVSHASATPQSLRQCTHIADGFWLRGPHRAYSQLTACQGNLRVGWNLSEHGQFPIKELVQWLLLSREL